MSLQLFPRPAGDVGLGAFSAEDPVVTLQDLIQLDVRVTWDEGVSIVEELCAAAQGSVMRPIPAAADILLNSNGTVTLRHSAAGVADPVEAARRLHELLGGSVAPAPLRLFISQAVSNGTYNTLSEFEDAVAYFAKPGRQERVKAVYNRASEQVSSKPQAADVQSALPRAVAAAPQPSYGTRTPAVHHARRQLILVGVAAAGVATMVVGLGLYLWPQGSPASAAAPATAQAPVLGAEAAAAPAAQAAAGTAADGSAPGVPAAAAAASQTRVIRSGSAVDVAAIPLTGSLAAIRYTGPRTGGSRRGTQTSNEPIDLPAFSSLAAPTSAGADVARVQPLPQQAGGGAPASRGFSSIPATSAPVSEPSQVLYSANDTSVQPALLTKPQLLPPPYSDRFGKPVRMELIISPVGTVERARFIEAPQRMADMMILSSAKTWLFTPAVKDGQPVRYRTVMSWVAAP